MTIRLRRQGWAMAVLVVLMTVPMPATRRVWAADGEGKRALTKEELLQQLMTKESRLELEQAKADMEQAKAEYDEIKGLFDEKIVALDELNEAKQAYEMARLGYRTAEIKLEKTKLQFLKDNTFITVTEAKKFRTETGQYKVSLCLRNDSDLRKSRTSMGETTMTDKELRSLLTIDNVVVSLYGTARDGTRSIEAIIGDPYQRIVPALPHGKVLELEFDLLERTLDALTIRLEYLGVRKEYTVKLKKEASRDLPTLASTQYAQEGQLGTKIRYDLELERLASTEQSFSLVVLNLPKAIPCTFIDPGSGARVTQLKFTEERSSQRLELEISIPEKLDASLVDTNIDFTVIVTRPGQLPALSKLLQRHQGKTVPAEDIAKVKGSKLGLKLIPTGVGKLDILVANLFKEVRRGDPVTFKFTLLNSGTLVLRNVTPELGPPLDWEGYTEPKSINVIEPADKEVFNVTLSPPEEVSIGEYTIKLAAEGKSGMESIEAVDKNFTVRIAAESNITGTVILVVVLVVLVLGIAVASIKISRR